MVDEGTDLGGDVAALVVDRVDRQLRVVPVGQQANQGPAAK